MTTYLPRSLLNDFDAKKATESITPLFDSLREHVSQALNTATTPAPAPEPVSMERIQTPEATAMTAPVQVPQFTPPQLPSVDEIMGRSSGATGNPGADVRSDIGGSSGTLGEIGPTRPIGTEGSGQDQGDTQPLTFKLPSVEEIMGRFAPEKTQPEAIPTTMSAQPITGTESVPGGAPAPVQRGPQDIEGYIRQAAARRGIDPNVAVAVANSEGGLSDPVRQSDYVNPKTGQREESYGPFQLYMGGGLGNAFQQATGKSPSDPSAWRQAVDFALDEAARGGWGPWHGAQRVGIGNRQGLEAAKPVGIEASADTGAVQGGRTPLPPAGQSTSLNFQQIADQWKGVPYVFGGAGGRSTKDVAPTDCSGFVAELTGLPAHTDAAYQELQRRGAVDVSLKDARPGDVVYWMGSGYGGDITYHTGLYAGNSKVLDMSTSGGTNGVALRPITHAGSDFKILRDPADPKTPDPPQNAAPPPPIVPAGVAEQVKGEKPSQTEIDQWSELATSFGQAADRIKGVPVAQALRSGNTMAMEDISGQGTAQAGNSAATGDSQSGAYGSPVVPSGGEGSASFGPPPRDIRGDYAPAPVEPGDYSLPQTAPTPPAAQPGGAVEPVGSAVSPAAGAPASLGDQIKSAFSNFGETIGNLLGGANTTAVNTLNRGAQAITDYGNLPPIEQATHELGQAAVQREAERPPGPFQGVGEAIGRTMAPVGEAIGAGVQRAGEALAPVGAEVNREIQAMPPQQRFPVQAIQAVGGLAAGEVGRMAPALRGVQRAASDVTGGAIPRPTPEETGQATEASIYAGQYLTPQAAFVPAQAGGEQVQAVSTQLDDLIRRYRAAESAGDAPLSKELGRTIEQIAGGRVPGETTDEMIQRAIRVVTGQTDRTRPLAVAAEDATSGLRGGAALPGEPGGLGGPPVSPRGGQIPRQDRAAELSNPINLTTDEEIKRIRLNKFPAEIHDELLQAAQASNFGQRLRRGVLGDEAVQTLAQQYPQSIDSAIAGSRRGRAYNAEEIVGLRNLVRSQAEKVDALGEKLLEPMTRQDYTAALAQHALEMDRLKAIGEIAFGGAPAEAGRALRQFRQIAQDMTQDPAAAGLRFLERRFGSEKNAEEIAAQYRVMVDQGANPVELTNFLRNVSTTNLDRLGIIRYGSMVGNATTQLVNTTGNLVQNTLDLIAKPIAVGIDVARVKGENALGGNLKREVFMAEVPAQFHGMIAGAAQGLDDALFTLKHGIQPNDLTRMDYLRSGFGTNIPVLAPQGSTRANVVNAIAEGPLRLLSASDALFRSMANGGHLAAEATADALKAGRGVDGKVSPEVLSEFMAKQEVQDRAASLAKRTVLQENRPLTDWVLKTRQLPQPQRLMAETVLPFVRTPFNVMAQGVEMTPPGAMGKILYDAAHGTATVRGTEDALARGVIGTTIMGAMGVLGTAGYMTAGYPEDAATRTTLPPGWQPWSFRMPMPDGSVKYFSYGNLGPIGVPMAVMGIMTEMQRKGELNPTDMATYGKAAFGVGQYLSDQTFLRGASDFLKAMKEGGTAVENYVEQAATQYSPYFIGGGSLGREIERAVGMAPRDPHGALEALLATHPLTAEQVPPRRDVLGRSQSQGDSGVAAFASPIRTSTERDAAVIKAFRQGGEGLPTTAPKQLRDPESGEMVPLNRKQQDTWRQIFGQELQIGWGEAGTPQDPAELRKIEQKARDRAAATVLGR